MNSPDENKLKQRVIDILAKWEQLLLNDFGDGRWARTSSGWYDFSLVYISKSKYHGERYVSAQTVASPSTSFRLILHSFIQNCECLQMRDIALYTV